MALNAERIKESLAKLRAARTAMFGADSHHFALNDPLSEETVGTFETLHGVSLPADYRHFLTAIGNGGAGPFYGVFPLGTMDDAFGLQSWKENDGIVCTLAEPFLLEGEWNDLTGKPSEVPLELIDPEFESKIEEFDARYWGSSIMNGAIPICHTGCALRIWLVLTGKQAGHLWYDARAEFGGIAAMTLSDGSSLTFAAWYEEWVDICLREARLDF
jgi:hypothetical protein